MSQKWTQEQFATAMQQISDFDDLDGFLDYSEPEVVDVILDLACQRNELLSLVAELRQVAFGEGETDAPLDLKVRRILAEAL